MTQEDKKKNPQPETGTVQPTIDLGVTTPTPTQDPIEDTELLSSTFNEQALIDLHKAALKSGYTRDIVAFHELLQRSEEAREDAYKAAQYFGFPNTKEKLFELVGVDDEVPLRKKIESQTVIDIVNLEKDLKLAGLEGKITDKDDPEKTNIEKNKELVELAAEGKGELSLKQSALNSVNNALIRLRGWDNRLDQAYAISKGDLESLQANEEILSNLDEQVKPVYEPTDVNFSDGVQAEDFKHLAAATLNALTGFGVSAVESLVGRATGAVTGGVTGAAGGSLAGLATLGPAGFVGGGAAGFTLGAAYGGTFGAVGGYASDMIATEIISANKEKAKEMGISLQELVKRGEAELVNPVQFGILQSAIEKFQLKGLAKALKAAPRSFKNFLLRLTSVGTTNGVQELGQEMASIANEAYARAEGRSQVTGQDVSRLEEAYKEITDSRNSKRLINATLNGVLGGKGSVFIGSTAHTINTSAKNKMSKIISAIRTPKQYEEQAEIISNLESIQEDRANPDITPQEEQILDQAEKANLDRIRDIQEENLQVVERMEETEVSRSEEIYDELNKISDNIRLIENADHISIENKRKYTAPLNAKIGELTTELSNLREVAKERAEPIQATVAVAPFYEREVMSVDDAEGMRNAEEYQVYMETINDAAKIMGIKINGIDQAIGGYYLDKLDKPITEVSNVINVEAENLDQVAEYAALLGALTPEVQESTIAGREVEETDPTFDTDVYRVKVSDSQKTLDALKKANITEFTLNETENTLTLFQPHKYRTPDFVQKMDSFLDELEQNNVNYETNEKIAAESRYIDSDARQQILQDVRKRALQETDQGSVLLDKIEQALINNSKFNETPLDADEQGANDLAELLGDQPLFSKGNFEEVNSADVESIRAEMDQMDPEIQAFTVPSDLTTKEQLDYESIRDRFPGKINVLETEDVKKLFGVPHGFTISDQLFTGTYLNEETGNTHELDGGIGFTGKYDDLAWAVVKEGDMRTPNAAVQIYENNKPLFERLWRSGVLPNGHVPFAILKMGDSSMESNEAVYRIAADNISNKFPKRNRVRAKKVLVEEVKKDADFVKLNQKTKDLVLDYMNQYETIDDVLKNISDLTPISARSPIYKRLFIGNMSFNTDPKPGKTQKPAAKELLRNMPDDYNKYLHAQTINRQIQEPATKNIPADHVIGITAVNVLNPESVPINHKNYKGGIRGKMIGVLRNPIHAADIFPEMYSKSVYTYKPNKNGVLPTQKVAVQQSVASSGAVAVTKAFRGAKMTEKMDEMSKLMGKLKLAFPDVTVIESKQEFDEKLADPSISKYVKRGEQVYGFTTSEEGKPQIFINPDYRSTKLALHEYGHVWLDFLRQNNPELLQTGFSLLEGTSVLRKSILENGDNELARDEAMAELISNRGETIIEAANKSKFQNWLTGLFNYVKEKFRAFTNMSSKDFQEMTLEDFVDGSLQSMLSGEEVKVKNIQTRFSKQGIQDIINVGLKNAIPEAGIKKYLVEKGYDTDQINQNYDALVKEYREQGAVKEGLFDPKKRHVYKMLDHVYRRLLSSKGYKSRSMQQASEFMTGSIQASVAQARATSVKLYNALENVRDIDNVVTNVDRLMRGQDYQLPKKIEGIAKQMRQQIDVLSKQIIDGGYAMTKANAAKIEMSLGSYLTRSYKVFDLDNWSEELQSTDDGKRTIQRAYNYIIGQEKTQKKAQEIAQQTLRPYDDVLHELTEKNIQDIITGQETSNYVKASREGAMDLNALKRRKDIPEQIRALMGEYTDPVQNYQRTILRVSSLLESMKYLDRVRKAGYNVFLFDKNDKNRPPEYNVEIAAPTTESYSPLSGLMTTKEIADAVKNEPMLSGRLFDSPIVKSYLKAVGVVKYNKTILSPGTHGKNVIGNLFFMAMNGYTDPAAYTRAFAEARGRMKALELDELSERYDKLLRLGVVDQSVAVRELNAMFGEEDVEKHIQTILERRQGAFSAEDMLKMSGWVKGAKALKKNVLNPSQNAYQLEDDYFKLVSFDIESNRLAQLRYKKDYSQLSEKEMQEIDLEAAETTKNLLPNYSRIGQLGLMMKAVPVFGTFISFQLESYRTAYNTIDLALKEIKDPAKRRIGAKRLVGTAAVQFINHYALASLGKMLVPGTDPDDEEQNEFIKLVLPTWAKNSEKVLVAAEPGKFTYIDLSASNPHGQMERAMNAVLKGTDPKDAAYEFFMEAFGPFVSEDITFATMKRIVTNSNSYGGELIKTDDTPMEQFEKVFMELYRAAEPGIARSATKIYKSDNKLFEFLGQMTGYKPQTVDYRKQMEFTSREINQEVRSLSKYSKAKREYNDGKITLEELDQQFRNNEQNKLKIYGRAMKLYRGALHFGVSPVDAREAMKKGGIPVYIIDQIENGNLEYVRR